MQPVLIQANVPTENAANWQNGNYHIDHGNVEYSIQNESRPSSPDIADIVDHENIELDVQNEPMPPSGSTKYKSRNGSTKYACKSRNGSTKYGQQQ